MSDTKQGFTIVELLVVIVVIAILAAVSVVSYLGIQDRARASQVVSALDIYEKAFRLYKSEHGQYPSISENNSYGVNHPVVCLGEAAHYPETQDFTYGTCVHKDMIAQDESNLASRVNPELNNLLRKYTSTLPDVSSANLRLTTISSQRGMLTQSAGHSAIIYYYIESDAPCGRGEKQSIDLGQLFPTETGRVVTLCQIVLS